LNVAVRNRKNLPVQRQNPAIKAGSGESIWPSVSHKQTQSLGVSAEQKKPVIQDIKLKPAIGVFNVRFYYYDGTFYCNMIRTRVTLIVDNHYLWADKREWL
jgi:hypothetical protein